MQALAVEMSDDYRRLRDRVDAFSAAVFARRREDFSCVEGCSSCCEVHLGVTRVEADEIATFLETLAPAVRAAIAARADREERGDPRCVMLGDDGLCDVYPARPLVCRSQGLPLRYPTGFVPEAALRTRLPSGDVTVCPLNFRERDPAPADVLDAERVDAMLGLVDRLVAGAAEGSDRGPPARVTLRDLARGL